MKKIKNCDVMGFFRWSIVAKVMLATLLLAHLWFGVLSLETAGDDSLAWTDGHMGVGTPLLQEEEVHPYAVAGETETGIIIIGGGGMMLLSNRRSGTKRMNNIL